MVDIKEFRRNLWSLISLLRDRTGSERAVRGVFGFIWLKMLSKKALLKESPIPVTSSPPSKRYSLLREEADYLAERYPHISFNEILVSAESICRNDSIFVDTALEYIEDAIGSIGREEMRGTACAIYDLMTKTFEETNRYGLALLPQLFIDIMVGVLDYEPEMVVYDPAFGYGRPFKCLSQRPDNRPIRIAGQEIDREICTLTKVIMEVFDVCSDGLRCGDTLGSPLHTQGYSVTQFDRVICEPPTGMRLGREELESDGYMRFIYGIPRTGEWAFIEHGISSLKKNGKLVSSVQNGALIREVPDGIIRQNLVKHDLVEAVIQLPALPSKFSPPTSSILIINRDKPETRKGSVLMVSISPELLNEERPEASVVPLALDTYARWEEVDGLSQIVSFSEMETHGFSLLPSAYIMQMPFSRETAKLIKAISRLPGIRIGEIAEVSSGADKRRFRTTTEIDGAIKVYLLKISDIENDGELNLENAETIYVRDLDEVERIRLYPDDIVLSSKGSIDKIALAREYGEGTIVAAGANLLRIRVDPARYPARALYELLKSEYGKSLLSQISTGTVIRGLSVRNVENIKVPKVDKKRFMEYSKAAEKLRKEINDLQAKIAELVKAEREQFNNLFIHDESLPLNQKKTAE
ncbi:MAG TPA: N-6 DNA methylase [Mesotoga infera]|jgi:type I restriction enzyme M protein|nr:N-6 DNA methylase [Mesotoga sp.]HPD39223.1 N-6 DNA methylase [Mesotoga infera]HRR45254.1 N-6 DNA methylase [Mesotoga sp.]HRV01053.1 N-6 DNA methylase [Mesotoga sp.]